MHELAQLKPISTLLSDFVDDPNFESEVCEEFDDTLVSDEISQTQNFYKTAKIEKCSEKKFLQQERLDRQEFLEYLAPILITNSTAQVKEFQEFQEEFETNAHKMAEEQIACIFKEIY